MGDEGHHTLLDEPLIRGRVRRERNSAATNTEARRCDSRAVTGLLSGNAGSARQQTRRQPKELLLLTSIVSWSDATELHIVVK